jgi:hypothetical protein
MRVMDVNALADMANLLDRRNELDAQIAERIGRPMTSGHLGEWIAARIFQIELYPSASTAAADGHFASGPLEGRTVNVKWYPKREGLDMTVPVQPQEYLVMTGPAAPAISSRGQTRPWCIQSVHLFDADELRGKSEKRGLKIGVATSVRAQYWTEAQIFPESNNPRLHLTAEQREALQLFAPTL